MLLPYRVGQSVTWYRENGEELELEVISVGDRTLTAWDRTWSWQFGPYHFCDAPLAALTPQDLSEQPRRKLFDDMGLRDRIGVVAFIVLMGLALVMAIVDAVTGWPYWIATAAFWITLLLLHPVLCLGEWLIKKTRAYTRRKRVAS